ncbi:MAG: alpha/beta fold hydrolase [Cellvibrionaceae bacterium]
MSTKYRDIYYRVDQGLRLYARDYPGAASPTVLLCLHGLSRNSADFEPLCEFLSGRYRIISVDQRGRGLSQWDAEPSRYQLPNYVEDMWALLDQQGIDRVVVVGTSMGGLMGMLMAAQRPERIQGLVINDVGPEVDPKGLARIMGYVGKAVQVETWDDAVAQTKAINQVCFPNFTSEQWWAMARRTYRENDQGVPIPNYDPQISTPIHDEDSAAVPTDLWPIFESISVPLLALRGGLSDLMSADCLQTMATLQPHMQWVEIDGVGHAPVLDEPQAVAAIENFISQFADE